MAIMALMPCMDDGHHGTLALMPYARSNHQFDHQSHVTHVMYDMRCQQRGGRHAANAHVEDNEILNEKMWGELSFLSSFDLEKPIHTVLLTT